MNAFEDLEKANILYRDRKFGLAAEAYSKIATNLYITNENSDLGEIAMKLAIDAYRHIIDPILLYHIMKDANENLFLQFFSIRCYIDDHQIEKDTNKVQRIINHHIQLNHAEKRFTTYNMVIPSKPNQLHTATHRQASVITAQGPREAMEDLYMVGDVSISSHNKIPLFAVLDGHGGLGCAKFAKNHLKKMLVSHLKTRNDLSIYNSLTYICVLIDENWKAFVTRPSARYRDFSGTTLLFALIIHHALWVVSVGDSRAVLGKGKEAIQLSEDAKPPIEKYLMEIMHRGGFVKWKRVDGSLDMARSIGDIDHPSVSARPCIRKFDISGLNHDEKNILILATDGLWDVVGSQEAIHLCQKIKTPKAMAAELISAAYINGSMDNTTVMVITLS